MKRLTNAQVRRRRCVRCKKKPGYSVWQICADKNRQRVLCVECDIILNDAVLKWVRDPKRVSKMVRYVKHVS